MEKLLEKLSEHFGYAGPFLYAAAAYGFFHWLDENASDEAKALLARTMRLKDYKNEQVASALVEVFDRIYTYPLLRWRAFFRSLLFTTVVSAIFAFELIPYISDTSDFAYVVARACTEQSIREHPIVCNYKTRVIISIVATPFLVFNVLSDYLALFVIRTLLIRSGTKPVIGLVLGAVSGVAIVLAVNSLRTLLMAAVAAAVDPYFPLPSPEDFIVPSLFVWPALAVFAWLPFFALGILIARLLTPLSWIIGRTQWFLKEGKEHPLKAIGYIAAVVVFLGTVAGRVVFSA